MKELISISVYKDVKLANLLGTEIDNISIELK